MREVEASAKTVDDAIAKALQELGVGRDDVEVEVLSEGKPGGFLGIGGEDARVLVSISGNRAEPIKVAPRPAAAPVREDLGLPQDDDDGPVVLATEGESNEVIAAAEQVTAELLRLMGLRATIGRYEMPNSMDPEGPIVSVVDIQGDDLGVLIGRRGETLESLQYIVNLIVAKRLGKRVTVEVDVEGYRQRRVTNLQSLAKRMADRVRETGRSVALEPMNPKERRIVHLALQEDPDVVTESAGEGEGRKVVIHPR
jgi:spoIIIJ-associated protein